MLIRLATIEQIRAIEADADANGYSYTDMMDSAGRAIADRSIQILKKFEKPRLTIIIGKGNNGGDGLVAGLYIAQDHPDADVRFYLLAERDDEYIKTVREAGLFIALEADDKDKRVLRNMIASSDLVIDALFGIGARLPIKGEAQKILRNVNREINARRDAQPEKLIINPAKPAQIPSASSLYVLAVDCPSGMNCDTGEVDNDTIPADETITFISAKKGQFLYPAANYVGELTVADIGISKQLNAVKAVTDMVIDSSWAKKHLPNRGNNGHKGTYGRVLVIAGSTNYIGAPALSAEAAYRSGAGLVTIGTPISVVMALAGKLSEATWMMLPHDMGVISEGALSTVLKDLNKMKSLLVGPGLGSEKTTGDFLKQLLTVSNEEKKPGKRRLGFGTSTDDTTETDDEAVSLPPLIIDADGLNLLAEMDKWWDLLPENTVLTPHPGEMGRLCGISTADVQENRWQLAREKAKEWNIILVLKGAYTAIASPNDEFMLLPFAVDALATAGTGDILAGLIAGYLAQGLPAFEAACIAGYVHGLAGQIAGETKSSRSVIASDVLSYIGDALQAIES